MLMVIKILSILKSVALTLAFFIVTIFVITSIYSYTFAERRNIVFGILLSWAFIAYITIPRVHRKLSRLYLPNYYIGRTRTNDGLLGDPVNIAFNGKKSDIIATMKKSGWVMADELNRHSTVKMIRSTLLRRSYPSAPVSPLFLFGKEQDFTFQQEVGGTTSKRHHIRFWKCPAGWYLPGGLQADWLAAATYDRRVGLSLFTFQVTHKIEADIDTERDFVLDSITHANTHVSVHVVKNYSSSYHHRNGGGDKIKTDGALPFVSIL